MKLHINKIHDTHSVRSQLLRIFLLAGMFPLLVIGIFSIASVRKTECLPAMNLWRRQMACVLPPP